MKGLAVLVCAVHYCGYGFADLENQQPTQPDSLFRVASLSKPFTEAAVLALVEDGCAGRHHAHANRREPLFEAGRNVPSPDGGFFLEANRENPMAIVTIEECR